jgi:DNA-binding transcriptional ArsR family regulator
VSADRQPTTLAGEATLSSETSLPSETARAAAAALALLADDTRLKILWVLMQRELHVNALAELVGAKAPAVSQHLSKLRVAGMVSVRREGTYAYYRASDDHISRIVSTLVDHISEELAAQAEVSAERARRATER